MKAHSSSIEADSLSPDTAVSDRTMFWACQTDWQGHIYVMDELAAQIVSITAHTTLTEFTAEEWDRLNETAHPFLSYAFLSALEQSGSVGEQTGWDVLFLAAREEG
ncbi:MAG: peptidogalycan biosysnthesis protein, partial [Candidatus Puniceispirillaceae bacterium]